KNDRLGRPATTCVQPLSDRADRASGVEAVPLEHGRKTVGKATEENEAGRPTDENDFRIAE
ncbi:hypothetical protein, partial [Paenibacillus sp. GbtcB18]|uniref:hypothetical protein n=1 Tax=Paenibacillus sp. GbtcB18 TaxID=2824763 RepID=UPI001C3076BE